MKLLYAALRHDPLNPDLASGTDYNFYSTFVRHGFDIRLVGPFTEPPPLPERVFRKAYRAITGKRYLKWDFHSMKQAGKAVTIVDKEWKPDVIFTLFPPLVAYYEGSTPFVFRTDTTMQSWQANGAGFGSWAAKKHNAIERMAFERSALIITFSDWCKTEIVRQYSIDEAKVKVMPIPSALPFEVVPSGEWIPTKEIGTPLRLLLVGREYQRKGVDIALKIVQELRKRACDVSLTICGLTGDNSNEQVRFAGVFRKSVRSELEQYVSLYREAHLLIHPARFEPAGIVPAEAAAFGVPTITNDVGGLGTSVQNGVTGIVLPRHSPASTYADYIQTLLSNPEQYRALSLGARERYCNQQNWISAGDKTVGYIQELVSAR